jgi:serine/threonine protein kinase/Tfp pilus assembly protein PilF
MFANSRKLHLSDVEIDRLSQVYSSAEPFNARTVLNTISSPTSTVIADLAYEEYCRRIQRGEMVELAEFLDGFPEVASELRATIEVARLIEDHCPSFARVEAGLWPAPPTSFAGFRLLREIGRGATARVFEAEDLELGDRPVAVKVCRRCAGHEGALLGKLSHKHIVPVLSGRVVDGFDVLCMPHLSHATLQHVIGHLGRQHRSRLTAESILDAVRRRNALSHHPFRAALGESRPIGPRFADLVLDIATQIASGLSFAHSAGVIHGDIKPSNVLLTNDASALLFDFNLAVDKSAGDPVPGGTFPYMAPEQLQSIIGHDCDQPVDERTDVFSFGVTLYELFTGQSPFGCRSREDSDLTAAYALLARHRKGPDLARIRSAGACPRMTRLIGRCLQFEPADRFSSAVELEGQLHKLVRPVRRLLSRREFQHPRRMAAVTLGAASALAGVSSLWLMSRPSPPELLERGLAAYRRGDLETATRCFRDLAGVVPKTSNARLLLAACYLQTGDYGPAHAILEDLSRDTDNGIAWALLGYSYLKLTKEYRQAAYQFTRAASAGIRNAEVLNNWAYCALNSRDFGAARALLDESLMVDPDLPSARLNRAALELRTSVAEHRVPQMDDLERLEARYPDNIQIHLLAAKLLAMSARHGVSSINAAQQRLERAAALGANRDEVRDVTAAFPELRSPETALNRAAGVTAPEPLIFPFPDWPQPLLSAGDRDAAGQLSSLNNRTR